MVESATVTVVVSVTVAVVVAVTVEQLGPPRKPNVTVGSAVRVVVDVPAVAVRDRSGACPCHGTEASGGAQGRVRRFACAACASARGRAAPP